MPCLAQGVGEAMMVRLPLYRWAYTSAGQQLLDIVATHFDDRLVIGELAQRGGNADLDRHVWVWVGSVFMRG